MRGCPSVGVNRCTQQPIKATKHGPFSKAKQLNLYRKEKSKNKKKAKKKQTKERQRNKIVLQLDYYRQHPKSNFQEPLLRTKQKREQNQKFMHNRQSVTKEGKKNGKNNSCSLFPSTGSQYIFSFLYFCLWLLELLVRYFLSQSSSRLSSFHKASASELFRGKKEVLEGKDELLVSPKLGRISLV